MMHTNNFIVVDDDAISNLLCKSALCRYFGAPQIQLFSQPEKALEIISRGGTQSITTVIFLDINMPTMSGWDFLEIFNQFDHKIRSRFTIYMLSSSVDENDREMARLNPLVQGFLLKPINAEVLSSFFVFS